MVRTPKLDDKVKKRIPDMVVESLSKSNEDMSKLVEESLKTETRLAKIESEKKSKSLEKMRFVKSIREKLRSSDKDSINQEVKRLAEYYAHEIHGNFNRCLYIALQKVTPIALNFMLNSFSIVQFFKNFRGSKELRNKVMVRGNIELVKRLQKFGSLVIVPTHVSNFDSIVLGHMIHSAGLNPPLWGAGLNLFKGFTVSHIMSNVGCYKVDRRKKNRIYIETLKQYSTYHLERGYNAIFYPGGTRSRSGAIEKDLKLGLLSTAVSAYVNNIKSGKTVSNIYVVPVALSYTVVPEAETLALDHYFGQVKRKQILKDIGARATLLGRMVKKLWNNIVQNNPIYMTFGQPMDPFGNTVNSEGVSVDKNGIPVNVADMIKDENGNFIDNEKFIRQLTVKLGHKISDDFYKINVVLPTQIYVFSIIKYLQKKNPGLTDEELVKIPPLENAIPEEELIREINDTIELVRNKANSEGLKINYLVRRGDAEKILKYATRIYTSGYAANAVTKKDKTIIPSKIATILYYSSRLRCYFEEPEANTEI